uniref:ribonucleoside-diphosphate reductase n=1 Tax=viral metagenome TaxID=1070528 RepID=A0A6C0DQN8_9ZZZZ
MTDHMYVTKRNGDRVPVSFDEILQRVRRLSDGLEHVNPDLVAQKVCNQLTDGMPTSKLDEFAAETCAMMQAKYHPNYGKLASRIVIDNHHKTTPATLLECVEKLYHGKTQVISDEYHDLVCKHSDTYQEMICYDCDYMFDYFGFKTLERGYLLRVDGVTVERPQHMWMRVAIQLHSDKFVKVKETYDALSQGYFIHATPTLFNSGTQTPQLSSCFLVQMADDSIQGIYKTLGDCAQISKWAGGIGLSVHNIRARGSKIHGTNGESTGLVPMLKVFNDTAKYVNQGGKRNGSFAIYLEPWHADIEEFLRLRLNQGAEEDRARDLFYGLWICDLFMKRVEANAEWTLMCPRECPGLDEVWGEKFEELYTKYESEGKGRKSVPAQKIWQMILDCQIQTGNPYLCYKDAANSKSNQQNLGTIKSSNLCTEIMEYTSPKETAVCNLGSLALPKFVENGVFNFGKLQAYTAILARNLDIVIDKNFYPTPETRASNMRNRPIGIGVQGLADVFAMMRLPWSSPEAQKLNTAIFENIYYAACQSSIETAAANTAEGYWRGMPVIEKAGHYPSYSGSPTSKGKFQFDLWNVSSDSKLDWATLRLEMARYGIRNSLLVAPMPTASTSQILGNNECFEPFTSNLYTRRVLAGDFMVVNKYLVEDLIKLRLWNSWTREQIMNHNGSIQNIEEIPDDLKELYKTAWEIPQKTLINMSRDRAPFICQSQSLNLFLVEPTYAKISSMHIYAWKQGLKTGCYYLRTKAAASAQKFTVEPCQSCSA